MNFAAEEISKFDQQAHSWWDREGPSRALHDLNPERLAFIAEHASLAGARVLDLGCGGGILSEALAAAGARVTAIDLSIAQIEVARLHALESALTIDYRHSASATLAEDEPASFDVITCMEMLEHVPDPAAILSDCQRLLRPGGKLFLSTIHRNPKSFALAILGAEHVLRLLPVGTHRYEMFLRPSELARGLRAQGLCLRGLEGLHYDPFARRARRDREVSVNYLAWAEKPA